MCNSGLDFVLSTRGSIEVLQLTQHSMLGNQHDAAHVLRDSAFKCTLYRTFVQASPWCKRSLFTYADRVARMDLGMPF